MSESKMELIANQQALVAVILAAAERGIEVDALCSEAKGLLFDSGKPCKWASADSVTPSQAAIDWALKVATRRG